MVLRIRNVKESKKCVVKKTLTFEDYKNCLLANLGDVYRSQLMFRSSKHEVHTIEVNKVALNRDDDKWISKRDGLSTLARGHRRRGEFESAGADSNMRGCRHRNAKIEAKKGEFAKIWQKLGGGGATAPPAPPPMADINLYLGVLYLVSYCLDRTK